jgi:hypothetical protein
LVENYWLRLLSLYLFCQIIYIIILYIIIYIHEDMSMNDNEDVIFVWG